MCIVSSDLDNCGRYSCDLCFIGEESEVKFTTLANDTLASRLYNSHMLMLLRSCAVRSVKETSMEWY